MTLRSAYGAGNRAGRAQPNTQVVNGHKYLKTPVCPFTGWQFVSLFLWHEGYYNGLMERLAKRV